MSERIDIGGGHEIEYVGYAGEEKVAINDYHKRPDNSQPCQGFVSFTGKGWSNEFKGSPGHQSWDVVSWDPLTLTPSLLCRSCGDHGHITNGRWVKA